MALNIPYLKSLGVTHVVNCCKGNKISQTNTDSAFYKKEGISFHGIPAVDIPSFNMLPYLQPAADFIHKALEHGGEDIHLLFNLFCIVLVYSIATFFSPPDMCVCLLHQQKFV